MLATKNKQSIKESNVSPITFTKCGQFQIVLEKRYEKMSHLLYLDNSFTISKYQDTQRYLHSTYTQPVTEDDCEKYSDLMS